MLNDTLHQEICQLGEKYHSQGNEELLIRHFFAGQPGGFFVDIGCAHYQNDSTTYYLEKHLGWSGIAVDARGNLSQGYRRYRPNTKFYNYLVTDHANTMDRFYMAGVLSSTSLEHIKRYGASIRPTFKRTITLNQLLDNNAVESVDFVSMDIELSEEKALNGFDIQRFKPRLLCVEGTPLKRPRIIEYFASHGYRYIEEYKAYDNVNLYFQRLLGWQSPTEACSGKCQVEINLG